MKINYVIATYNDKGKRCHKKPLPENILRCHLEQLLKCDHNLTQITIMKAKSPEYYKNYYNIENIIEKFNIPVIQIDCENFGYSMGQWLKAYEIYKDDFDYYLFIEDDWCPNMNNFDNILFDIYKKKTQNNIGILCSVIEGSKEDYGPSSSTFQGKHPEHFGGCVFLSTSTIKKLYNDDKWEGNPRKYLDLMDKTIDDKVDWMYEKNVYKGGYYQLVFSHLFTLSGINHYDYLNEKYNDYQLQFIYWNDNIYNKKYGGWFLIYKKNETIKIKVKKIKNWKKEIENCLVIPVQLT